MSCSWGALLKQEGSLVGAAVVLVDVMSEEEGDIVGESGVVITEVVAVVMMDRAGVAGACVAGAIVVGVVVFDVMFVGCTHVA
jgi:hypothetical protein